MSLETFVKRAKKEKAEVIQYRNKSGDIEHSKKQLIKLRKLYDGFLIVNDYIDLNIYCDGVHIGQEDLIRFGGSIDALKREIGSDKLVGLSTHNKEEIEKANEMDLNYIGLGAYRETSTKSVGTVLGEQLFELAKLSKHPVAAIGGLKLSDTIDTAYKVVGSDMYEH